LLKFLEIPKGCVQGRSQTFSFGGATGGDSFATRGAVHGLCRTFRKRPAKFLGGHWGGRQNFGGALAPPGTPLAPPLVVSEAKTLLELFCLQPIAFG